MLIRFVRLEKKRVVSFRIHPFLIAFLDALAAKADVTKAQALTFLIYKGTGGKEGPLPSEAIFPVWHSSGKRTLKRLEKAAEIVGGELNEAG